MLAPQLITIFQHRLVGLVDAKVLMDTRQDVQRLYLIDHDVGNLRKILNNALRITVLMQQNLEGRRLDFQVRSRLIPFDMSVLYCSYMTLRRFKVPKDVVHVIMNLTFAVTHDDFRRSFKCIFNVMDQIRRAELGFATLTPGLWGDELISNVAQKLNAPQNLLHFTRPNGIE